VGFKLEQRINFHLPTPKFSSQENLTVPAADGMRNLRQTRLGTTSRSILQLLIVSTDKFREGLWGGQGHANEVLTQTGEDDLAEQALGAFSNLAKATAVDRGVVAQLTEANSRLAKQLEDNTTALKEVKALLKKSERNVHTVGTRNGHLAALSHPHRIIIAGLMVTK
jgi:hypothetical protein